MISDNIDAVAAAVNDEILRFQAGEITEKEMVTCIKLEKMSSQAILAGQGTLPDSTPGWIAYMELFAAGDKANLDRLIPRDGSTDDTKQTARTYLVANGKCGMGTTRNLANNVGNKLNLP